MVSQLAVQRSVFEPGAPLEAFFSQVGPLTAASALFLEVNAERVDAVVKSGRSELLVPNTCVLDATGRYQNALGYFERLAIFASVHGLDVN